MSSVTAVPLQPVKSSIKVWLWLGLVAGVAGAVALAWVGTREAATPHASAEAQQQAAVPEEPAAPQGLPAGDPAANAAFLAANKKSNPKVKETASGLQYEVLKEGTGAPATDGDTAHVTYAGTLIDGKPFDASQEPVPFQVIEGKTIPGFYEGMKLMRKGGEYRLWIPAALAYGEQSPDPARLPNNSVLIFTMKVGEIDRAGAAPQQ